MVTGFMNVIFFPVNAAASETSLGYSKCSAGHLEFIIKTLL